MGGGNWSDDDYSSRSVLRAQSNQPVFDYDHKVKSGNAPKKTHASLDPAAFKAGIRECRDSADHPLSKAVAIGLDVTGSMQQVPVTMQKKLPLIAGLLTTKGYLADASICPAGIGDVKHDDMPMQIGQFEADNRMEDHLTNLVLEGGGGGNNIESYDLFMYFLSRCVKMDNYEKRGEKGYAFIICDEDLPASLSRQEVRRVFGDQHTLEADISSDALVAEVLEKWELYVIVPNLTAHYSDKALHKNWTRLLNERVLFLEDPEAVSELIASTIGVLEEQADLDDIANDLTAKGTTASATTAVTKALSTVKSGGKMSKRNTEGTGLATL